MSQVGEHIEAQIEHFSATRVPPVEQLLTRLHRRQLRRRAAAGMASAGLLTVGALVLLAGVPASTGSSTGPLASDGSAPSSSRGDGSVPDLVRPAPGVPAVVPVTAPEGYVYDTASANRASRTGAFDMRSVLLRPASLESQPTVELCADRADAEPRCRAEGTVVRRDVEGHRVLVSLRGAGAEAAVPVWTSIELTTDPATSDLFTDD